MTTNKSIYAGIALATWLVITLACGLSTGSDSGLEAENPDPDPGDPVREIEADAEGQPAALDEAANDSALPSTYDPAGLNAGPGRGFEVLDDPIMIPAEAATWLDPDEIVLGVEWAGEARAYPISQMAYHHIVNDAVQGNPLLVTY